MNFQINNYGFVWGDILVERTCSQEKTKSRPFFQVLRVFTPNGEIIEITVTKRKNRIEIIPKENKKGVRG